ncbi:hypothetical protein AB5J62_18800 [Amycolatopsis sp. cg5]|uniref:hypothetical protein n=1 Tax=Amycolatopsis sp. cg5 TaxID=3238802 RepID=UPI003524A76D
MSIRLAFAVTAGPGLSYWLPTSGGRALPGSAGAPVALGPSDAEPEVVREATRRLGLLVRGGTEVAAGAGVDLGGGFSSARLAGAAGDRRDAVLAALRFLGVEGAERLGDRAAVLVAMFGPSATKRVGAAAHRAVEDRCWAALQLASAASDLLGPEQLERVLALRAPDGVDPFPHGAASTVADHLGRVLAGYPRPRRLALIESLWDEACAKLAERRRKDRLPATQTRIDRIDKLRVRHRTHFDEAIMQRLAWSVEGEPTLVDAARWRPPKWWTALELKRLLDDALAATALLRFAKTHSDEGLAAAAEKHRDELLVAESCLTEEQRTSALRRPQGGYSHPARPGCYAHQVVQVLSPKRTITEKTESYVKTRTAMARNYGVVVLDAVTDLLVGHDDEQLHNCWDTCKPWHAAQLRRWRDAAGFSRPPSAWEQPPLADAHADGPKRTLAQRIAVDQSDPASLETPHDLLWLADLADALAPFHGAELATVHHRRPSPELDYKTPAGPPTESVPLAAAEVAQLVRFGATPPPRCGSWADLVAGITANAVIAEASIGAFPVPAEVSTLDNQIVDGTDLIVELGREPKQLAEWSGYMGNCIGESWYADQARRGQCVLMALRDPADGRIVANLDIRRRTGGWHVYELRARFNDDVAESLDEHVKQWVDTIPAPAPPTAEPVVPVPPVRGGSGSGRRSSLSPELLGALTTAVTRELASAQATAARKAYVSLANGLGKPADFEPDAAVIALKRAAPAERADLVRSALGAVPALWRATRVRPLATAVTKLDPGLRTYDRLAALTDGSPLPRTLRALVRSPDISPAYAMDVVARAVRVAMGELIGEDALARSVALRPSIELVCVLAIAATCTPQSTMEQVAEPRKVLLPGFPASDLSDEDGPWQRAMPMAAELGAPVETFWDHIAEHGLLVPAALLGKGGWPALWRRTHR